MTEVTVVRRSEAVIGVFSSFAKVQAWAAVMGCDLDGFETFPVDELIDEDFKYEFADFFGYMEQAKVELTGAA